MGNIRELECIICCKAVCVEERTSKQFICSPDCDREFKRLKKYRIRTKRACCICGDIVSRPPSSLYARVTCGPVCSKENRRRHFSKLALKYNPTRMVPEVRAKLRGAHLGKGEGKAYRKTYGRHTHRVVAEEMLGRPLKKGEVVHHVDGDILNNNPDNLMVLSSQAEHVRLHMAERLHKSVKIERGGGA